MDSHDANTGDIFKDIRYYVVGNITDSIKEILQNGKAKCESYLSALATHVIVFDPNHYEVETARDLWQLPTITPEWVEWSSKCNICLPVEGFSALTTQLFSNMVVCFTHLPKPDRQALWSIVNFHGGKCQSKLNKNVTHLVALYDNEAKFDEALKHDGIKIVAPDWILDSINQKQLQDHEKYHPNLNIKEVLDSEKRTENEIENSATATDVQTSIPPCNVSQEQVTALAKNSDATSNIQQNINLMAPRYSMPMQVSYSLEQQQQLQNARFSLANQGLRQPITSTSPMMSPSGQQFAMIPTGMMMSPPPRALSSSPRRNSGNQTPGKKRKNSQSNRTPSVMPNFPSNPMYQQMMIRQRLPVDPNAPRMQINPDGKTGPMTPGRFPGPPKSGENFPQGVMGQHIGSTMVQTSPRGPQPIRMDQKWQKSPGFENQPMFHTQANMGPAGTMLRQPGMAPVRGHPPFNPLMVMNRFPMQMNQQRGNSPQQQQQLMAQQKSRFPTSTSLAAAGMEGISPVALQQGLIKAAQMQADQPALIHPSLQGTLFPKVPVSAQGGTGTQQKKRNKSRKKNENPDEDLKQKAKPRMKNKKPQDQMVAQLQGGMLHTQINHPGMPQPQFQIQGGMIIGGQIPNEQLLQQQQQQLMMQQSIMSNTSMPTLQQHQQQQPKAVPLFSSEMAKYVQQPPATIATNDAAKTAVEEAKQESPGRINRSFDPLYSSFPATDDHYFGRSSNDKVTSDLFLLGCVFCIFQYDEILQDLSTIDLWIKMIYKFGGAVENSYTNLCTHVMCVSCDSQLVKQAIVAGKRCVTVYWLNDVIHLRKLRPPWLVMHVPTLFSHSNRPLTSQVIGYTGFHFKERERMKMMTYMCGAKITSYFGRNNNLLLFKNTTSEKFAKAQELMIPCVTLNWLRDVLHSDGSIVPDINSEKYKTADPSSLDGFLLDVEKSKVLLESWKTPITISPESILKSKIKRKYEDNALQSSTKRPKFQPSPRICFTGLHPAAVLGLTKKVSSLNCQVEETLTLCTHLVAQKVSRTIKFLSCISSCSYVVTPDWIDECERRKMWLDESKFVLVDKEAEEKFDFSLKESVKRARKKQLFKDCIFVVTPNVVPERSTLKQILECAGGRLISKIPSPQIVKRSETKNENRILIVSCPEDEPIYKSFKKEGLAVHNSEIILTGVLKQQINTEIYRL